MARPVREMPTLSPGQASYVLERMIKDRRVSARDVGRYVAEMKREIDELELRLQNLREASGGGNGSAAGAGRRRGRPALASASAGGPAPASRAKKRITPEQRASRQLQGRYLGLIRQIPASRRAQYQKIAKDRGREAAIKELASALGK